jgi:hypothetical protein
MKVRVGALELAAGGPAGGCSTPTADHPSPGTSAPDTHRSPDAAELTDRCGTPPTTQFTLGHEAGGTIIGNSGPLDSTVDRGSTFVLSAKCTPRHLGTFPATGDNLHLRCDVDVPGPEGGTGRGTGGDGTGHGTHLHRHGRRQRLRRHPVDRPDHGDGPVAPNRQQRR